MLVLLLHTDRNISHSASRKSWIHLLNMLGAGLEGDAITVRESCRLVKVSFSVSSDLVQGTHLDFPGRSQSLPASLRSSLSGRAILNDRREASLPAARRSLVGMASTELVAPDRPETLSTCSHLGSQSSQENRCHSVHCDSRENTRRGRSLRALELRSGRLRASEIPEITRIDFRERSRRSEGLQCATQ